MGIIKDKDIKWPYQSKNWTGPKWVDSPDSYRQWKGMPVHPKRPGMKIVEEIERGVESLTGGFRKRQDTALEIEPVDYNKKKKGR